MITLDLKPSLEAQLRKEAAREGVDAEAIVVRTLEQQFGVSGGGDEASLLAEITEGPPDAVWVRYRELGEKRDAEKLTAAEHVELIAISEQLESQRVRRLEQLWALARLRGVGLGEVQAQLGINAGQE